MKRIALFLFALLLTVALAAPSYACNPATAAAFAQAAGFNSYGFGAPAFVAVPTHGCGARSFGRVGYGVGARRAFVAAPIPLATGGNVIIQNGRRNRIR